MVMYVTVPHGIATNLFILMCDHDFTKLARVKCYEHKSEISDGTMTGSNVYLHKVCVAFAEHHGNWEIGSVNRIIATLMKVCFKEEESSCRGHVMRPTKCFLVQVPDMYFSTLLNSWT